ncbi:hypothetical protein [Streptomyces sp. NPDC059828]|uniref:hypothetical protein n=1 Tax=Streptomyces sp. NPDC059828 TaxID=3346965 RepID=UPI00365FCE52
MSDDLSPHGYDNANIPDGLKGAEEVRQGPLWRHALWVVGVAVLGVGLGWASARFRIGPEEYGLPSVAPGPLLPYLAIWTVIGLLSGAVLRAAAARVPVYAPEGIAFATTALGTRMTLGWRPEMPMVALMAGVALTAAAAWGLIALRGSAGTPTTS